MDDWFPRHTPTRERPNEGRGTRRLCLFSLLFSSFRRARARVTTHRRAFGDTGKSHPTHPGDARATSFFPRNEDGLFAGRMTRRVGGFGSRGIESRDFLRHVSFRRRRTRNPEPTGGGDTTPVRGTDSTPGATSAGRSAAQTVVPAVPLARVAPARVFRRTDRRTRRSSARGRRVDGWTEIDTSRRSSSRRRRVVASSLRRRRPPGHVVVVRVGCRGPFFPLSFVTNCTRAR